MIKQLKISDICRAVSAGQPGSDAAVTDVVTDSRKVTPGSLFVALKGENYDGHDFVRKAFENGASFAVVSRETIADDRLVKVRDTLEALMDIAALYRLEFRPLTVAVTGSVGKTTTKDLTARVLSAKYNTLKSPGNLNNEIGIPQTIFTLSDEHEAAVFELGMQGLGEIRRLAGIVRPQIGIITNIGVSHLERLKTRENILRAKLELADCLPDGAPLIICTDNDMLEKVDIERLNVIRCALQDKNADISAGEIVGSGFGCSFKIRYKNGEYEAHLPAMGNHMVQNALLAFATGICADIGPEECVKALGGYTPSGMRQKMYRLKNTMIVEDCYNASPDSVAAALATLSKMKCSGDKIAVLSDMLELGEAEVSGHTQAGKLAAQLGITVYAVGNRASLYVEGARSLSGKARLFRNKEELADELREKLEGDNIMWFKASRGMKLEEVVCRLSPDSDGKD